MYSYHHIHQLNLELSKKCNLPGVVQQSCQRSAIGVEPDLEKSLASERRNLRNRLDNESSNLQLLLPNEYPGIHRAH